MNPTFKKLMLSFCTLLLLFVACKKPVIQPVPNHPEPRSSHYIRFTIDQLPGEGTILAGLKASVLITNNQGQAVLDTVLALLHDGHYVSDSFQLPAGNYRLSKFLVLGANNATRFATPITNSAKAPLVQKPLQIPFSVLKTNITSLSLEVLRLSTGDRPQDYGYPAGSFETGDPVVNIKTIYIQPLIKIGDVIYDSIPVSFTLTSWDANGQMTVKTITLQPGKTQLELSTAMTKYQFKVMKWGTTDELTVLQNELQDGAVYSLGGSKAAKRLLSEISSREVGGVFKAESKKQYEYATDNKLLRIVHQQKRADNSIYTAMIENFIYTGNQVTTIRKYGEDNNLLATTAFIYGNNGKLSTIRHNESGIQTDGAVEYHSVPGGTGISGDHGIHVKYTYTDRYYTMDYNKHFIGGNMIEDAAITSHHSSELGIYQYDFKINPYIHLKVPDLFLTHTSKHNKIYQQKTFYAHYPLVEPYSFEYVYDSDDYPTQLLTKYRNYGSVAHQYSIKTVYTYHT
ncbi:MAG: hypothetical protein V4725_18700 [Bacteroidota bacterium]